MGYNSAFKGLIATTYILASDTTCK